MDALFTLLVFGGFWFWAVVMLASLFIVVFLECNQASNATVVSICTIVFLVCLGNLGVFDWVTTHPLQLILYGGGYLVVGVLYGILKWYLLLRNRADNYREVRTRWLEKRIKDDPGTILAKACNSALSTGRLETLVLVAWKKYVKDYNDEYYHRKRINKPSANCKKGLIISWMTYWPWSGLWTLINDPIRRIFKYLYRRITTLLQNMADRVFADIESELED